jgi:carnitine 3-dehydrogenase
MFRKDIDHVAVVGTGVIGAGWTALFLEQGISVTATDVGVNAEEKLRTWLQVNAPQVPQNLLAFNTDLESAVQCAHFVQECGPEELEFKQDIFRKLDIYTAPDILLASSSSGITPTVFQATAIHQERILLGHPFNPPHIMPLVEVCGGINTSAQAISTAIEFYRSLGKNPIHLRKEMKGHVANRLQAALWQEALYLVKEGVVSVEDLDAAITEGPGLRWALLGPLMNMHLGGGEQGIRHFLEHLGAPMQCWMEDLGKVQINEELISLISTAIAALGYENQIPRLMQERDGFLKSIKDLKAKTNILK